jgi:hypothetical protein
VGKLVDLANARGGHDNVTVVVLRAREPAIVKGPSGVAPTVAQTQVTPAHATAPSSSSSTLVEPPLHRALEPARPLEPTPAPPQSVRSAPPVRRGGPAVIVGLVLAALAVALLVGELLEEVSERGGKRNAKTWPTGVDVHPADAAPDAPTTLEPEAVPAPAGEPIVPLDLSPPTGPKHKR